MSVVLLLGGALSLERILHPGIVYDVHEVAHQLLRFHHQPAQFCQAVELVGELNQFRHILQDVEGTQANFLVVAALRAESGNVLHRQLVEFLHRGHAHRVEFHLLLLGSDGIQAQVMLVFNQFLGSRIGGYHLDAVLVNDNAPACKSLDGGCCHQRHRQK